MAEPAAAAPAPEATQATETPAPPTAAERVQAALEKGKAAVAASKSQDGSEVEPEAETETPETEGDKTEEPDAAAKAKEGEEEKPEPKTARAKEWAKITRVKQAQATQAREIARREAAMQQERAELSRIQQEYVEMNRLFRESPKQFIEKLSGRPGGLRDLFEQAVQEEKRTPEEEEKLTLKKELEDLKAWRKEKQEAEEKQKRDEQQRREQEQTRESHAQNFQRAQELVRDLVKDGAYPNVAEVTKTTYGLHAVSGDIYNRILLTWDNGNGRERPISEVLNDVEAELAKAAGSGSSQASPPVRADGAVEPAKPEAKPKRTPPSLTNERASARASAGRELKGDERKRYFASLLRTRPD